MTGQLQPGRVAEARQQPHDSRTGGSPDGPPTSVYGAIRQTGSSVTTTTDRNEKVAVLPNPGKQHLTKSTGGARCRSSLAAAM